MRRMPGVYVVLLTCFLACLLVGCGRQIAWVHAHANRNITRVGLCASGDCGIYSATMNWSIPFAGTTGYYEYIASTQVGSTTAASYTFYGMDCGTTYTLGVKAHNSGGGTSGLYTSSYTTPNCLFTGSDDFTDPAINLGNWTPVDNTIGNTNALQCDAASRASESGGNLSISVVSGSFTCAGPTGGNGGITSCPSGTCSTVLQGDEVQWRDFAFEHGTVSVTAKLIGSAGTSGADPAIWMLGYNCQNPQFLVAGNDPPPCSWPHVGSEEMDLVEVKDYSGGGSDDEAWSWLFANGNSTGVGCTPSAGSGLPSGWSASGAFHTYEMDWSSTQIAFKVDGTTTCSMCTAASGCTFNSQTLAAAPEFLILTGGQMEDTTTLPSNTTSTFENVVVTPSGPLPSVPPSISGSFVHGSTLTAAAGSWSGSPTYTYQWLTCNSSGLACSPITTGSSCTTTLFTCSSSYTTTSGEIGDDIQMLVQATNGSGVVQVGSTPVGVIS